MRNDTSGQAKLKNCRAGLYGRRIHYVGPLAQGTRRTLVKHGIALCRSSLPLAEADIRQAELAILVGRRAGATLRSIRATGIGIPIVVLGPSEPAADLLSSGADDVQSSDIDARELVARLEALDRRDRTVHDQEPDILPIGSGIYDTCTRDIVGSESRRTLSALQDELLRLLAARPGRVIPYGRMEHLISSKSQYSKRRSLSVHMARLRNALQVSIGEQLTIAAERGVGYRITQF